VHSSDKNTLNPFVSEEASENYANADFLYEQSARNAVEFYKPLDPSLRIADLGAGTGVSTKILLESGIQSVVLIDPSAAMLQQAEKKFASRATYIQASAEDFASHFNQDLDLIYALNCFHLFADLTKVLEQIKKASANNAHFIFNVSMPSFCFGDLLPDEYLCVKANRDFYFNLASHSDSPLILNTVKLFDRLLANDFDGLVGKRSMELMLDFHNLKLNKYAEFAIEGDAAAQKIIWELVSTCLIPDKAERQDFINQQELPEKMFFRQAFFDILVNND